MFPVVELAPPDRMPDFHQENALTDRDGPSVPGNPGPHGFFPARHRLGLYETLAQLGIPCAKAFQDF